jgi:hypothetical protein
MGLPAEKADQIFNAFFTTKPQGSGMGLAITRSIVESQGGRLWATANDGPAQHFILLCRSPPKHCWNPPEHNAVLLRHLATDSSRHLAVYLDCTIRSFLQSDWAAAPQDQMRWPV